MVNSFRERFYKELTGAENLVKKRILGSSVGMCVGCGLGLGGRGGRLGSDRVKSGLKSVCSAQALPYI